MDSDQGKLFVGGISWETTEDKLGEYFGNFGQVIQALIVRDGNTGRPRGFGFVVFSDPSILDGIIQDKHSIDGRTVEVKRAISREEQHKSGLRTGVRSSNSGGNNIKTKKIFVGGLPATLTEEEFRQYFEPYGHVTDVVVMFDQNTNRPRGFGFVSFETEDAVDRVLHKSFHDLNGKTVEVKRALPKDGGHGGGNYSSGGGGYQGYDSSGSANGSMQALGNGGGFVDYGSGYGPQAYPYAAMSNAFGYGGYGVVNYAMMGMGAGYNVPPGAYGNPNASFGNGQYGGNGAAAAYVDSGYGYYGGSDESYANQSSYDGGKENVNERDDDYAGAQVGYAAVHSEQAQQH
ncbi:Heteroproteinous nuclear ribonucleoprotein 1 [Ranunculus cassubicifolius]